MIAVPERGAPARPTLRVRWLGRVRYADAHAVQHGLFAHGADDWLLLLEHDHVFTLGARGDRSHVLVDPVDVGADLVEVDRGGDVTYHGPGQLVGYPILRVPGKRGGGMADTVAYVRSVEQVVIDALRDLGLDDVGRLDDYPGVWVAPGGPTPRKIAAVGVRLVRGRSMHGFALNVDPDLAYFGHIVPCGILGKPVTSLAAEGLVTTMRDAVDAVAARAVERWGGAGRVARAERADVVWRESPDDLSPFSRGIMPARSGGGGGDLGDGGSDGSGGGGGNGSGGDIGSEPSGGEAVRAASGGGSGPGTVRPEGTSVRLAGRLAAAGVDGGLAVGARKPPWVRAQLHLGEDYVRLRRTMRELDLVTVCEEAGCPNIFECWADGTATFMINGERCTRACGFCLVDTRHPEPLDASEPERVAAAVERMGLQFAVVTAVARDDLADGGAGAFAATIAAIRARTPGVEVEVLIPDCKGDPAALATIFDARPDVCNHNIETVPRLQRAVRPSASYARSLAVLARAKQAGLVVKSGLIVGMGETNDEVLATLADLRGVGVDIVTIGQYLRPTALHLPVHRWVTPEQFEAFARAGRDLGFAHVESSPLTRSSYHARQSAQGHTLAAT